MQRGWEHGQYSILHQVHRYLTKVEAWCVIRSRGLEGYPSASARGRFTVKTNRPYPTLLQVFSPIPCGTRSGDHRAPKLSRENQLSTGSCQTPNQRAKCYRANLIETCGRRWIAEDLVMELADNLEQRRVSAEVDIELSNDRVGIQIGGER